MSVFKPTARRGWAIFLRPCANLLDSSILETLQYFSFEGQNQRQAKINSTNDKLQLDQLIGRLQPIKTKTENSYKDFCSNVLKDMIKV